MLRFYHFISHPDISSIVFEKFSFYYGLSYNICKLIIQQLLRYLSHFYPSFGMTTCYFCAFIFSSEKDQIKYIFINKNYNICEVFKSFGVQKINQQVSKRALDSAMILSMFLFYFCNFQGIYDSFVYINVFSTCTDTLSHQRLESVQYVSREKMLYFEQLTDFEKFSDSK